MNWVEIDIFTTTDGIEAVTGSLLGMGVNGFVIKDSADFEDFLSDKTVNWDYIDDDLMGLKNCETTVTVYLPENAQGLENLEAIEDDGDIYESIEEIWPDYPSKEDFFFDEEEY